ncbi:hypothetical protein QBC34DRAFT_143514 [Podospora aff. communis PSN243]|uniref:Myb-like domain-containing protein n=1 Tax=Podospora aff. communis PSN243 TaxID=3040156 RepID=A0AAV9GG66_9PEZI|nr:hypothetical protein QBC34DRAFT_143514 [Podospora aff. communis PSN243]
MFITDSQPHVVGHHPWSATSDFSTLTPCLHNFPGPEHWDLGIYAQVQLEYRRLLAMPSGAGPNNEWTKSKPRSHSKKNRHQRQPPQSQQAQRLNSVVSDDTSRAFPWGDAGFGGNFLPLQAGTPPFDVNHFPEQSSPQPSFGPMLSTPTNPSHTISDADFVKLEAEAAALEAFHFLKSPGGAFEPSWQSPQITDMPMQNISDMPPPVPGTVSGGRPIPLPTFGSAFSTQGVNCMPTMDYHSPSNDNLNDFNSFSSSNATDMLGGTALVSSSDRLTYLPDGLPDMSSDSDTTMNGLPNVCADSNIQMSDLRIPPLGYHQPQILQSLSSWMPQDRSSLQPPTLPPSLTRNKPTPVPSPSASTDSIVGTYIKESREAELASVSTSSASLRTENIKAEVVVNVSGHAPPKKARTRLPDKPRSSVRPSAPPILRSNIAPVKPKTDRKASNEDSPRRLKTSQRHRERSPSPKPSAELPTTKRRHTKHSLRATPAVDYTLPSSSPESSQGSPLSTTPQPRTLPTPSLTPASSSSRKRTTSMKKEEPKSSKKQEKPIIPNPSSDEDDEHMDEDELEARGSFATRADADAFLVKSRESGMTYRDIRVKGGFTEAESTLRGRYRTLTKKREERVRRPEWSETDIRLLEEGVRKLARLPPSSTGYTRSSSSRILSERELPMAKVPWKQVAEYIVNNGGTYRFGNSTCRKRWDELRASQTAKSGRRGGGVGVE